MDPLRDCESEISDSDAVQWRQVHPNYVDGDLVSMEAFVGTPDATRQVSTAQEAQVTAQEAHEEYVALNPSAGSWPVAVSDIEDAGCRCVDDSSCPDSQLTGHSYIDMRHLEKKPRKGARMKLAAAATASGRTYP